MLGAATAGITGRTDAPDCVTPIAQRTTLPRLTPVARSPASPDLRPPGCMQNLEDELFEQLWELVGERVANGETHLRFVIGSRCAGDWENPRVHARYQHLRAALLERDDEYEIQHTRHHWKSDCACEQLMPCMHFIEVNWSHKQEFIHGV